MLVPFDQLPVGDGRGPDGRTVPFYVDRRTLDRLKAKGRLEKHGDARFIPMAAAEPDAIFVGLRRPNQNEGLCYAVRPESDPEEENEFAGQPCYGFAFLVFVEVREIGYVVFDWEWREEDPEMPGHPLNWKTDFDRRVYP